MRALIKLPTMVQESATQATPVRRLAPGTEESGQRGNLLTGLRAPCDAAVAHEPPGKAMARTVDSFRWFIGDPFPYGKVAANHARGNIFVMGAKPQIESPNRRPQAASRAPPSDTSVVQPTRWSRGAETAT